VTRWVDDVDCVAVAVTALAPPTYGNGTTVSLSPAHYSINDDGSAPEARTTSERMDAHDWCLRKYCADDTVYGLPNGNLRNVKRRLSDVTTSLRV